MTILNTVAGFNLGWSVTLSFLLSAAQFIPCDVATVCFGMAASMGAFLLGAGSSGKRKSLPNSRIMIHQPLGGAAGQAADIEIQVTHPKLWSNRLRNLLLIFSRCPQNTMLACKMASRGQDIACSA